MTEPNPTSSKPIRLHIGGVEPRAGWSILNVQPGPHVDYIGECTDLSRFVDGSIDEVYASHVYEHLGYQQELPLALSEIHRILKPGGLLRIAVPDLDILCQLFVHPSLSLQDRFHVMRMIFGGQMDLFDFHKVGLNWLILCDFLDKAGFTSARRIESFGLFEDCSTIKFAGHSISLNVEARK
jgi:predicted SAM-dependent methyltransferase